MLDSRRLETREGPPRADGGSGSQILRSIGETDNEEAWSALVVEDLKGKEGMKGGRAGHVPVSSVAIDYRRDLPLPSTRLEVRS